MPRVRVAEECSLIGCLVPYRTVSLTTTLVKFSHSVHLFELFNFSINIGSVVLYPMFL